MRGEGAPKANRRIHRVSRPVKYIATLDLPNKCTEHSKWVEPEHGFQFFQHGGPKPAIYSALNQLDHNFAELLRERAQKNPLVVKKFVEREVPPPEGTGNTVRLLDIEQQSLHKLTICRYRGDTMIML